MSGMLKVGADRFLSDDYERASFLPVVKHKQTGKRSLGVPQVAKDVLSALMLPGDAYQGNVPMYGADGRTSPQMIEGAANLAGMITVGAGAIPAGPNSLRMGIKAYHGSPHDFDRFDMSKIGTGEGAQAYGHGLYFAESENVAKSYKDTLSKSHRFENKYYIDGKLVPKSEMTKSQQLAMMAADDPSKADQIRQVKPSDYWSQSDIDEAVELAKAGRVSYTPPGRMYEVNIDADPNDFLDWDKPLSEQPKAMQALSPVIDPYGMGNTDKYAPMMGEELIRGLEQKQLVNDFRGNMPPDNYNAAPKVTQQLRQAGIPGIKYLDAGSRGAGDGSRNYVVFDDKLISIVKKYGVAALVSAGVISQQQGEEMKAQGFN